MEYVAFTDESYISGGERFRSISSFSFLKRHQNDIEIELQELLKESSVKEFKWEKLKDAKYRFCAEKIIEYVLNNLHVRKMRIDVVIWDTQDSRHNIRNRDDRANFERMFYHLLKTSMERREHSAHWWIYPDQKNDVDWLTTQDCVSAVGRRMTPQSRLSIESDLRQNIFTLEGVQEVISHESPASQVADLFAGLSVFSRTHYDNYERWLATSSPQISMFEMDNHTFSNKEKERFKVLDRFDARCKSCKLGVSLKSSKGLYTYKPRNAINFWQYIPQHEYDKAPLRNHGYRSSKTS